MGWRAVPMRSCSGILWRGGPQLTRCRCHQPTLGANRGGVPRNATLRGRHVTFRAQPHPREWAVHGGFQAAPRSPHYWSRDRSRPANCAFLWRSGVFSWKGRGPSAVDSTPPGAAPKYPDPGQQGNDLSRSRGDWIRSGPGLFPSGFPSPPTTCLNFSLWRDLSVWRIRGGYFSHRRSGLGGVY